MILIPVGLGAGSFIEGDRIRWCKGLAGVVVATIGDLVVVRTDDGITRVAGEDFIDFEDVS